MRDHLSQKRVLGNLACVAGGFVVVSLHPTRSLHGISRNFTEFHGISRSRALPNKTARYAGYWEVGCKFVKSLFIIMFWFSTRVHRRKLLSCTSEQTTSENMSLNHMSACPGALPPVYSAIAALGNIPKLHKQTTVCLG